MSKRQIIYLSLAVLGGITTWYFNIQFMLQSGGAFGLMDFINGGMANAASSSLTMDVFIAATAGFTWIIIESKKLGMQRPWLYVLLGCFIAFAFAFPLFLFMRERHLQKQAAQ